MYLNCASDAASQRGVAAPDGAPDFFINNFCRSILMYLNYASGAAPQQGVAAKDRALEFVLF
jgi:hypothetical protein